MAALVLWFLMNVALPLLPLLLVSALIRLLDWNKRLVDVLGDGQLYFFSVTLWGVFSFDALKAGKLEPLALALVLFSSITLMCFYTISVVVSHSGLAKETPGFSATSTRRLTYASMASTIFTIVGVFYLRIFLGLL